MLVDDGRTDQAPMFGAGGRIPSVAAVTLAPTSMTGTLREGWMPRHTVAFPLLATLLFLGYSAASGAAVSGVFGHLLLGCMAAIGALVLTTYLPLRGATRGATSSCTLMPAFLVAGAGMLLDQASGTLGAGIGLAVLAMALWQRLSGASAC